MTTNLIPASRVALTDPRTELPSREWYLYWLNNSLMVTALDTRVTTLENEIVALKAELQALLVPFSDGFSYGFAS